MKQEDKELLLKDLCARLPHRVKGHYKYYDIIGGRECLTDENDGNITSINVVLGNPIKINGYYIEVEYVKPYLRPMSSMTEEEYEELKSISSYYGFALYKYIGDWCPNYEMIDWLNAYHFDYHGLIEKGIALEAPEDMYNLKEK